MAKRQSRESTPAPRGPRPKRGVPYRDALPYQISGRVTLETFQRVEALRDTLRTHNGEIIGQGVELLIKGLNAEDRRYFEASLQRIRRLTQ